MVKITSKFRNRFRSYVRRYNLSRLYYRSGWANIVAACGGLLLVALYGFPVESRDVLVYIGYFGFVFNSVFAFFNFQRYKSLKKTLKIKK